MAINVVGDSQTFNYTGNIQNFTLTASGIYKLEVWGSKGGNASMGGSTFNGGNGGYACGYKLLNAGTTLYIGCGGTNAYSESVISGGFNGGGSAVGYHRVYEQQWWFRYYGGVGGGATHIALRNGTLPNLSSYTSDVLIVGGGGGGAIGRYNETNGGWNWRENGNVGGSTTSLTSTFGQGYNGNASNNRAGGGGGWYGGSYNYGGSSSTANVPSFTFNGVTYSPSQSAGNNGSTGKAKLTLMAILCYVKVNGSWLSGTPYVKDNGTWKVGSLYTKDNGTWK